MNEDTLDDNEDPEFEVLRSKLDKNFHKGNKLSLNQFKKVHITKKLTKKYKGRGKLVEFMRDQNPKYNDECIMWIDNDGDYACAITYDSKYDENGYKWVSGLDVAYKYQGHGLGAQMIDEAVRNGVNALNCQYNNEIALKLYLSKGFKISEESKRKVQNGKAFHYSLFLG